MHPGPGAIAGGGVMIEILTGDFRELSQDLADDSVDLVLTDPPYPKEFLPLWEDLGRVAARVLRPSKSLIAYSGQQWLDEIMAMLGKYLVWYWQVILLLPGGRSRVNARAMFQEWKPILIYSKAPIKRTRNWGPDVLISPTSSKQYHEWGQSLPPVRELVERFSEPGDLVLDPFLGGGTTAIACLQTNWRFIGYEIDPETADIARRRVERERLFVPKPEPMQLSMDAIGLPRCKFCGAILESNGRPGRKREYCNDLCRLRAFRFRQAEVKRNGVAMETQP